MSKLVTNDVTGGYADVTAINDNNTLIEAAVENTLSLDGTLPNSMSADFDMDSNNILNANTVSADAVQIGGVSVVPGDTLTVDTAANVPNVPAGDIAATDVQSAINELDSEKVGIAGTETITGSKTFSAALVTTSTVNNDGVVTNNSTVINKVGSDVASATALTLGVGNYFDITGTTAITSIATKGIGTQVTLQFDGVLTLTHHATDLILPGAANITTAAGDIAVMYEYATGDWRCISYTRASAFPLIYEEGTWVPDLQDANATPDSATMDYSVGTYEKIGRAVYFRGKFKTTSLGTMDGFNMRIAGLPYTSSNTANSDSAIYCSVGNGLSITAGTTIAGYVQLDKAWINLTVWNVATGTQTLGVSDLTATTELTFSGSYYV